jgi:hypothetical protein
MHLAGGAARDRDGSGDIEWVRADEDDIGGLDGDVRAGPDRDADVSLPTLAALSAGRTSASTSSIPSSAATRRAVS